jgi:hypothetical protein
MNQLTKSEPFSLTPKSLDEAMKYADMLSKSSIVPKGYQGKAGDILVAVQMGQELGLKPIQALQNIAVINGKPSMYGDSCLALVKAHHSFEDIKEWYDDATETAHCEIKRKGQSWHKTSFSKIDAQKAQLWGKQGPWTQYTKRMQQMRARGFCVRDVFPDALQGLIFAEEAEDYPMENVTSSAPQSKASQLADLIAPTTVAKVVEAEVIVPQEETKDFFETVIELKALVEAHSVPIDTIAKWLEKANASCFEEMPDEAVLKCITHIKEKYA